MLYYVVIKQLILSFLVLAKKLAFDVKNMDFSKVAVTTVLKYARNHSDQESEHSIIGILEFFWGEQSGKNLGLGTNTGVTFISLQILSMFLAVMRLILLTIQ